MKLHTKLFDALPVVITLSGIAVGAWLNLGTPAAALADPAAPAGRTPMIWEDRGELTPAKVFFGPASEDGSPLSRLPAPPFSNFERDESHSKRNPKCYMTDANGVKWTAKFGIEVHPDIASPRLAWALGFGVDETYYVPQGRVSGVDVHTNRGLEAPYVHPDGSFSEARFKRHPEHHAKDGKGNDLFWDEAKNPGVPEQQLSGLKIFDVMVYNWDAQPKNCEILKAKNDSGKSDWYIMSDMGRGFGKPKTQWNLADYSAQPFITSVDSKDVNFSFDDALPSENECHRHIPIADVQWFRGIVDKLTEDEIRAAFNAAVATPELTAAYAAGDIAKANSLTTPEVNGFVAQFRRRIEELDAKVPS